MLVCFLPVIGKNLAPRNCFLFHGSLAKVAFEGSDAEEGAEGSRRPSCLSFWGAGGAKVLFRNVIACFLNVSLVQRRSTKLYK